MHQPQVLAPIPQHNKAGCLSHLHWQVPRSFVSHPPLPSSRGSVRGWDWAGCLLPEGWQRLPQTFLPTGWPGRPAAQHLGHVLQALLAPGGCCSASLRRSAFPWWDVPPHPPEPRLHPRSLPLPHSPATALPHLREQLRRPPWRSLPQGGQPCPGCPDWAPAPWHVPGSGGSLPKSS